MRDRRVRHTHSLLDGKTVPIDQAFMVGNSFMMYPKNSETFGTDAGEVVNCRCSVKYTMPKAYDKWITGRELKLNTGEVGERSFLPSDDTKYREQRERYVAKQDKSTFGVDIRKGNSANELQQNYKKIVRGKGKIFSDQRFEKLSAKRVEGYQSEVYVSDKAKIKPKALHQINKNTEEAMRAYGIPLNRKPTIVIVSERELPTAWGGMTL